MFVSIIETVILPVGLGFLLNYMYGKTETFHKIQPLMPGVAVLGLACVVGGVISSQGSKFFQSGVVIFVAVLLHNGLGYLLGYGAGKLVGMNTSKKRTISIEVGMQNAGLPPIWPQRPLSSPPHRNPRSSAPSPVPGIRSPERCWLVCSPFMTREKKQKKASKYRKHLHQKQNISIERIYTQKKSGPSGQFRMNPLSSYKFIW